MFKLNNSRSIEIGSSRDPIAIPIDPSFDRVVYIIPFSISSLFPFYIYTLLLFLFLLNLFSPSLCHGILDNHAVRQRVQTDELELDSLVGRGKFETVSKEKYNNSSNFDWLKKTIYSLNERERVQRRRKKGTAVFIFESFHRRSLCCNTKINYGKPEKKKKSIDLSSVGRTRTGVGNPLSVRSTFVH